VKRVLLDDFPLSSLAEEEAQEAKSGPEGGGADELED
jgi:hypothetical protein